MGGVPAREVVVIPRLRIRAIVIVVLAALALTLTPGAAEAQRRYRRATRVVFVAGFGYYPHWYSPWWNGWHRGYPYYYGIDAHVARLRVDVEPTQAQVFVDGYYAGLVDEFDGVFQRLHVQPGGRTVTIYLEGYRTEERRLYLRPGTDQRIRFNMQPLLPGERSLPPVPGPEPIYDEGGVPDGQLPPPVRTAPVEPGPAVQQAPARFGTLAMHVRPAGAEILIDGERFDAEADGTTLRVQLPEGRHRVEVRRPGLPVYTEDVLIRRDRTLTLNVVLE